MLANLVPSRSRTTMSQVILVTLMYFPIFGSLGASCKEEYWMDINPICLGLLEGQEDCLYINVYRPEADEEEEEDEPKELLPVSCTSAKKGES